MSESESASSSTLITVSTCETDRRSQVDTGEGERRLRRFPMRFRRQWRDAAFVSHRGAGLQVSVHRRQQTVSFRILLGSPAGRRSLKVGQDCHHSPVQTMEETSVFCFSLPPTSKGEQQTHPGQ
ncbi:hypothetical protein JOB18_031854 [Solea senegalensis]|uniref:Uncharacterized protein n=1 Tax=Solea senegalensis TaxID=28829 RepID=A0AAV6RTI3_SOLSE|nr:hypothetical protein JOB18_031854 [Solea senegalensis]